MNTFSPYNFIKIIEKINPLFKKGQAGNAKDFIIFILERIHKELKDNINNLNLNNFNSVYKYDKKIDYKHFYEKFKKNTTIISEIFYGIIEIKNICINCQYNFNSIGLIEPIRYNYQIFNCLIFPLEEIRNMRKKVLHINNNNTITLYDCFHYNQKN